MVVPMVTVGSLCFFICKHCFPLMPKDKKLYDFNFVNGFDWSLIVPVLYFSIVLFYFYIYFSDSETTEDEGGDQFETKEDGGDVEDQAVPTGIQHGSSLRLLLLIMFFICVLFYWFLQLSRYLEF